MGKVSEALERKTKMNGGGNEHIKDDDSGHILYLKQRKNIFLILQITILRQN